MQTSTSGGVFAVTEPCRECRGRGMVVDEPCPVCLGSGRGKSTKTMQVRIPAGVTDGQRIRLKGRGGAGENGGAAGDLYVTVHVRSHPIFGRKGDNLTLTFSPLLADRTIYVLDVASGDKTQRKQGPGMMNADLLVSQTCTTNPDPCAAAAEQACEEGTCMAMCDASTSTCRRPSSTCDQRRKP